MRPEVEKLSCTILTSSEFEEALAATEERHRIAYQKLCDFLQSGTHTHGLDMKRLNGALFRLKLGRAARVLVVHHVKEGRSYWLMMDLLPHHEYKNKIPNFEFSRADALLSEHLNYSDQETHAGGAKPETAAGQNGGGASKISFFEGDIYDGSLISYSTDQDRYFEALGDELAKELCVSLLVGCPGAGKTLLALGLLERFLMQDQQAIYMTASQVLRHRLQEDLQHSIFVNEANKESISIVNYTGLLKKFRLLNETGDKLLIGDLELSVVDDIDFQAFFEGNKKSAKQVGKAQKKSGGASKNKKGGGSKKSSNDILGHVSFEHFKQECSVMTGTLEEYLALGVSHSLFSGKPDLKQTLWLLFEAYKKHLHSDNQCHLDYPPDFETVCEQSVLVDECFDLNRFQLRSLLAICSKLVFMGDLNQALTDTSNTAEYLVGKIGEEGATYILKGTHRLSKNGACVANAILDIKKLLNLPTSPFKDTIIESLSLTLGSVKAQTFEPIDDLEWKDSTTTAMICHPSQQSFWIERDINLVFSAGEIKGLGYPRIVIVDLLQKDFKATDKLAKLFMKMQKEGKQSRGTLTAEDLQCINDLNALYVAVTRSEAEIILMQTQAPTHAIEQLIKYFCKDMHARSTEEINHETIMERTSERDWKNEQGRLEKAGLVAHADLVRKRIEKQEKSKLIFVTTILEKKKVGGGKQAGRLKSIKVRIRIDFSKPLNANDLKNLLVLDDEELKKVTPEQFVSFLMVDCIDRGKDVINDLLAFYSKIKKVSPNFFADTSKRFEDFRNKLSKVTRKSVAAYVLAKTTCQSLLHGTVDFSQAYQINFNAWFASSYDEFCKAMVAESMPEVVFASLLFVHAHGAELLKEWLKSRPGDCLKVLTVKNLSHRVGGFQDNETPLHSLLRMQVGIDVLMDWLQNHQEHFVNTMTSEVLSVVAENEPLAGVTPLSMIVSTSKGLGLLNHWLVNHPMSFKKTITGESLLKGFDLPQGRSPLMLIFTNLEGLAFLTSWLEKDVNSFKAVITGEVLLKKVNSALLKNSDTITLNSLLDCLLQQPQGIELCEKWFDKDYVSFMMAIMNYDHGLTQVPGSCLSNVGCDSLLSKFSEVLFDYARATPSAQRGGLFGNASAGGGSKDLDLEDEKTQQLLSPT